VSAERIEFAGERKFARMASTEPRSRERGERGANGQSGDHDPGASTEPRSRERGECAIPSGPHLEIPSFNGAALT